MYSLTIKPQILAIAFSASSLLFTSGVYADSHETYADVLNVEEIMETVDTPREVCDEVTTTEQAPPSQNKEVGGTVIGAVAGGLVGSLIGGGTGKTLAIIAGATAGGITGNKVVKKTGETTTTTRKQNCRIETGPMETVVGYNVTYRIGDKASTIRTNFKPGDRIPVKDGKLVFKQ